MEAVQGVCEEVLGVQIAEFSPIVQTIFVGFLLAVTEAVVHIRNCI